MEYPKAFNCLTRVQFHSNQGKSNDFDERVQGKFLKGSFLGSKMDIFFGDGVGGLPCSQPLLPVSVLGCVISCSSGLGQRDLRRLLGDLKTAPPRRHRIHILRVQFWPPVQSKHVLERVKKWTPSKSKVVPSGGSSCGPFIWVHLLQSHRAIRAENCKLKLI